MRLIFLKLDVDVIWQHERAQRRQHVPLEELSFLFNCSLTLESDYPERRLYGRKSVSLFETSGAPVMALENLSESTIAHQVVPTTASGLQGEQPLAN